MHLTLPLFQFVDATKINGNLVSRVLSGDELSWIRYNAGHAKQQRRDMGHPRRPRGSQSSREERRDESFQVCANLFRPYLKTFVTPFLPTWLTTPGSPRMDRGTPLPTENLEKQCLAIPFVFLSRGDRGGWEAFGITDFYKVTKSNDQYSNDLVIWNIILLHEKFLQFDWLRAVVFQLNL